QWEGLEYQDTVDSGRKKETKAFTFYQMEMEEISERYITPCFMDGLNAYDGEINLEGELYFVKFIINPEEDDVEPGIVFGRSFLRLTKGIVDFENGIITIYPDIITFNDNSDDELDDLLSNIDVSDLPPLDITHIPPFMCSMGKNARNNKQPSKNYKMSYDGEGPPLTVNRPLTREELSREELEKDL
ncbi:hypothetical protein Tco_1442989, partial [Tanacetum coccineum]